MAPRHVELTLSRYRAGFGIAEITAYEPGMAMLGWGVPENVPTGVAEPLFARAMVVSDGAETIAYVCADLCFVSVALRLRVLELLDPSLRIAPRALTITATHTHSGPSGFSHAFFYDLTGPGYSPRVTEIIAKGIASAIREAAMRAEPSALGLSSIRIPRAEPIAFNRSLDAFARNAEVRGRIASDAAVDRTLTLIAARDRRDRLIGALSFFALHATSVHSDGRAIHCDHKGMAAAALERWARANGASDAFVGIFAQGAAGDVTPNYRGSRRGFTVGRYDADQDSAAYVAGVQAAAARSLLDGRGAVLDGPIGSALAHVDFGPRAALGIAMAEGTAEGPGPLRALAPIVAATKGPRDPKRVLLEVGPGVRRRLLGRFDPLALPLRHPAIDHARRVLARGGLADAHTWIPTILPLSLVRIGWLVLAGLPNEPTTMAGARLAARLRARLAPQGIRHVHVGGYANGYSGYLTTPEEYEAQRYEGAYTLFGPRTWDRFAHELDALADSLAHEHGAPPGPALQRCTEAELAARSPG
jgi:neutral ceramidase